jgi:hypothetical protein
MDQELDWFRKGRATLDMVIADQPEGVALGKDRNVVVSWTVKKMEGKTWGHAAAMNGLCWLSSGNQPAIKSLERKKSVTGALRIANFDRFRTSQNAQYTHQAKQAKWTGVWSAH